MRSKLATGILVVGLFAAAMARGDGKPSVESIGDQVMCLCGCVATLNHCPHIDCSTREEMKAVIQKEIAAGKDETAILQDLAIRYGVQVLASPPTKGFDLTVWILPAIALLAGLALVVVIVRRWRKPVAVPTTASQRPGDPKLLAAVEEEIRKSGLGIRD